MSILLIGCEAGAPRLDLQGAPAELEPGYVSAPPLSKSGPRRGVPGCRRSEPRTSASPAIEIHSSGGVDGSGTGNVQIWEDGTVLFDGVGCPNGSRRRGKMSPARVRALIDNLELALFFMWPCEKAVRCSDAFITSLTVQRGRADNTVVDSGCGWEPNPVAHAIEFVRQVVGKNACNPNCLVTPAPSYCL